MAVSPEELGAEATSRPSPAPSDGTRSVHHAHAAAGAVAAAREVSREELVDALTCPIAGKLFVDPVTSPCGHTFSRACLARWMSQPGQAPSCPTCRAPLYHESPHQWPVNTVLVHLAERFLGDELSEARASEPTTDFPAFDSRAFGPGGGYGSSGGADGTGRNEAGAAGGGGGGGGELPLFVLDAMTPGQELTLNVFEERYKLMVRRCLQATRRFGMVGLVDERNERSRRRRPDEDGGGEGENGDARDAGYRVGDAGDGDEDAGDDEHGRPPHVAHHRGGHRRGGGLLGLVSQLTAWVILRFLFLSFSPLLPYRSCACYFPGHQ